MEKHHGPASEEDFYQEGEAPSPDDIQDPDIIISPDTRRGAERVPPGQTRTRKWPVLDARGTPEIDLNHWIFQVAKNDFVERELTFTLDEFRSLPSVRVFGDFHCVTRWSRLGNVWTGVSTRHIAELAGLNSKAKFVLIAGYDWGWTTNVPIESFLAEDSVFAWLHDGEPLTADHGGPVRLIIPSLYAWKSAKWVAGIKFLGTDEPGYWERGGYHMRGNPWIGADGERFRD